jgi:hypothetical protein
MCPGPGSVRNTVLAVDYDGTLATAAIESGQEQSAEHSRAAVAEATGRRYTEPG